MLAIECINFNDSKVGGRHPRPRRRHDHHNETTLNVTDEHEKKDHIQPLELTLNLHRLLQVSDDSIDLPNSHQLHQTEAKHYIAKSHV